MHIKSVVISGFKSYKDEVNINNFDKGFNVIVGRNGSGKSNLFAAIQLVLTEDFNRLSPMARTALLHMGVAKHDAAYVEIIFDNSDKSLPFDEEEVSFKRYIGGKKDRYVVNGKNVVQFKEFLETAGFVNPYYFVKQGCVTEIATATNATRLKILKEVTGSFVWEESKKKFHKKMGAVLNKLNKIQVTIENIEKVKLDLKEEEVKLNEVLNLEKHKRAYEYLLYDRETKEISGKLTYLENERSALMDELKPIQIELTKNTNELMTHQESTKKFTQIKTTIMGERVSILKNLDLTIEMKSKERNSLNDLLTELQGSKQSKEDLQNKLNEIENEKNSLETELNVLLPKYENCKRQNDRMSQNYTELKATSDQHRSKYGLIGKEKDLKGRIKEIETELKNKSKEFSDSEQRLTKITEDLQTFEENLKKVKEELLGNIQRRTELEAQFIEVRQPMMNKEIGRGKALERESRIEQSLSQHKDTEGNLRQQLNKIAGKGKASAWNGIDIVLREMRTAGGEEFENILDGYIGPVFENISCPQKCWTAVEVCAGEKLFFHIVESNTIGLKILKEFNRMKLRGDVVFLPLDKIHVPNSKEIDEQGTESIKRRIKYSPRVQKAVDYIFENKLLCKSLELAVRASKLHRTTCVTQDGDKVSCVGPMTGGYRDSTNSVLGFQRQRSAELTKISEYESELEAVKAELNEIDESFQELNKQKETIESKLARVNSIIDKHNMDVKLWMEKLRIKQDEKNQEERRVEKLRKMCDELKRQLGALQEQSKLGKNGKENDIRWDKASIKILRDDRQQNVDACLKSRETYQQLAKLEKKKTKLESRIRNLADKKLELEISVESTSEGIIQLKINEIKHRIKTLTKSIKNDQEKLQELDQKVSDSDKQLKELKKTLSTLEHQERGIQEKIHRQTSELSNIVIQENALSGRLEECKMKTNSIGSYPVLVKQFEKLKDKAISKKLRAVNIRLKELPCVNRKATELLNDTDGTFTDLEAEILAAQEGHQAVQDLFKCLDDDKSMFVLKTCRALQKNFREIFSELVPHGAAEMVLTTNGELEFNELTVLENTNICELWDNNEFTGLTLRVRFTGDFATKCVDFKGFSGGEKSIVALSLILALQTCDPVSLYLFDEVDQALDPEYRNAVGEKLKEMSKNAQFICSTFRREFLEFADQFFGVYFKNQASKVKPVSQEEAYEFIDDTPEVIQSPENRDDFDEIFRRDFRRKIFGDDFADIMGDVSLDENSPPSPTLSHNTSANFNPLDESVSGPPSPTISHSTSATNFNDTLDI